ncbi:MAG: glycosyl transferase group 1, partial [bacterium]|nr:glycosyl transferase group 1 [bacterium]
ERLCAWRPCAMRILVVTNMFPSKTYPHYGVFVAEHARSLQGAGVECDVFFSNPRERRSNYLRDVPRLARLLRSGDYDLLHAQHSYSVYQAAVAKRMAGCQAPLVFTTHEGEAFFPSGREDSTADILKRLIYSRRLKRWAFAASDFVVSVEATLPKLTGYVGDYDTIPPGVDLDRFRPMASRACRDAVGLPKEGQIVFFPADPARFAKGGDLFSAAVPHVKTPIHVVTGGHIGREQMVWYMNSADVVVQTSRYEASPMVIKEALACGAAVVSTRVGDVEALFSGTDAVFLVDSEKAAIARGIEAALDAPRSLRGRERISALGLSLESVAARYIDLFEGVISGRALSSDQREAGSFDEAPEFQSVPLD